MIGISLAHLRRSGGHAVALWLMGHVSKSALSNANRWGKPFFKITTWMLDDAEATNSDGTVRRSTKPLDKRVITDAIHGETISKDLFLISYEDPDLDSWVPSWPTDFPGVTQHHRLLVLRSFYNHIASRVAYMDTRTVFAAPGYKPDRIDWWLRHAREALMSEKEFYRYVSFDTWFQSFDYRCRLEEALGLPRNDSYLHIVGSDGSGSSFDKRRLSGRAQSMRVLERWRTGVLPPEALENDEARELNHRLFGWTLTKDGKYVS